MADLGIKEACGCSDALPRCGAAKAEVIGISKDPVADGSWIENGKHGRRYTELDRSTFLIDAKGAIRRNGEVQGYVDEVFAAANELRAP